MVPTVAAEWSVLTRTATAISSFTYKFLDSYSNNPKLKLVQIILMYNFLEVEMRDNRRATGYHT